MIPLSMFLCLTIWSIILVGVGIFVLHTNKIIAITCGVAGWTWMFYGLPLTKMALAAVGIY